MAMTKFRFGLLALCAGFTTTAHAHVSIEPRSVGSGPFKVTFRIPHGCKGSPTTSVSVSIPEGIIGVKPAPKPGWSVATAKGRHARAYNYFHGRTEAEGVKEVSWTEGELADDQFDEFQIIGFVTDAFNPGDSVHFNVTQLCKNGRMDWVERQDAHGHGHGSEVAFPAPSFVVKQPAGQ